MDRRILLGSVAGASLLAGGIMGCAEERAVVRTETAPPTEQIEAQARQPSGKQQQAAAQPKAVREGNRIRYTLAYPTGDRETSALLLEKIAPAQARVGERYPYTIRVTNLTDAPLAGVVVSESADGFEIETSKPEAQGTEERPGTWMVGTLAPGETKKIEVVSVAQDTGRKGACLAVDYEPTLCTLVEVVNPQLKLTKAGPETAYSCEELVYTYTVSNVGTGVAQNVVVSETLPDGLTTADGQTAFAVEIGDLPAGEAREVAVRLQPTQIGTFESRAIARSADDEVVSKLVATTVVQPSLDVSVSGPEWQYANEPVTYSVNVTNTSDVPARDTVLRVAAPGLPEDAASRQLGTIAPGDSETVNVTIQGGKEPIELAAAAQSVCAPRAQDQVVTAIRTLPALLLETVDQVDPVRVGDTTTYSVVVRNQGSAPAANVAVKAALPPNMKFVEAEGTTNVRQRGNTLNFGVIESLPPGAVASWQVEVQAQRPGDSRFRTELSSDFLEQPVPDEEPTRVVRPAQ